MAVGMPLNNAIRRTIRLLTVFGIAASLSASGLVAFLGLEAFTAWAGVDFGFFLLLGSNGNRFRLDSEAIDLNR